MGCRLLETQGSLLAALAAAVRPLPEVATLGALRRLCVTAWPALGSSAADGLVRPGRLPHSFISLLPVEKKGLEKQEASFLSSLRLLMPYNVHFEPNVAIPIFSVAVRNLPPLLNDVFLSCFAAFTPCMDFSRSYVATFAIYLGHCLMLSFLVAESPLLPSCPSQPDPESKH